ncbi:ATP-binding cassette domain-containing protein [Flexivirga sp. ID2601S]|uniref:ATP-binding cassette domain-containing protein n=1 Tax=Flexivirga aerilata TaxID=1656889 RepID=A0A849AJ84_9MICO|nr:ATP-binding cassette domain-containing protein [Flexivirga aerilata]NNG39897.1 ATP-binding cassette domain-containing protein [Flexivirga aerilata]
MTGAASPIARLQGFGWRPLGRKQQVITGLDLTVAPGERVLLAGGSGAGKSTVLRALTGALGSTVAGDPSGLVEVDGRAGLLLQNPADSLVAATIGREVAFGPENLSLPRDQIWSRVHECLDAVGLRYPTGRSTAALSGGELQRLALAGVLAVRPGLLLLDEPTSMLDDETAATVREAIVRAAASTGAAMLVVEHRIGPWLPHVDRVVVLERGAVIADTTPGAFARTEHDRMLRAGVWMPGAAAPAPLAVPGDLVTPDSPGVDVDAESISVDLELRTLRGAVRTRALDHVTARAAAGYLTALTGPSGAGKSTLLAALAGLQPLTGGSIAGPTPPLQRRRSPQLAAAAGWAPQNPEHGFLARTVRDEISLTAGKLGRRVDVDALLDLVGLADLGGANPYQLSGGEQRRVALIAALAHRPAAMFLDEPTVGQDRQTWAAVAGWCTAAAAAGATVAVATHDTDLIALSDAEVALARKQVA